MQIAQKLIVSVIATLGASGSVFAGFTAVTQSSDAAQVSLEYSPLSVTMLDMPFVSQTAHSGALSVDLSGYTLSMSLLNSGGINPVGPGGLDAAPQPGTYALSYDNEVISSGLTSASLSASGSTVTISNGTMLQTFENPVAALNTFMQGATSLSFSGVASPLGSSVTIVVPEPATLGLLALAGLALVRRR